MIVNVKPSLLRNTAIAAVVLALLSACGQPGPLYLPKPPAKPASTPPAK